MPAPREHEPTTTGPWDWSVLPPIPERQPNRAGGSSQNSWVRWSDTEQTGRQTEHDGSDTSTTRASDVRGETTLQRERTPKGRLSATGRQAAKIPRWIDSGELLTLADKANLIAEYQRVREGDPRQRGMTASGLANFVRARGVSLASKQGALGEYFLEGTEFTLDVPGTMVVPRGEV